MASITGSVVGGGSAGAGGNAASTDSINSAALPYSPAKVKAANRAAAYVTRASVPLLLLRIRKGLLGPVRVRILLAVCIFFALLLAARRVGPFMGWVNHASPSVSSPSRGGYTVIINTWKRNSLLKQAVAHYASCSHMDSIRVVWSESDPPSDSLTEYLRKIVFSQSKSAHKPNFRFEVNEEDNLNNRFKPIADLQSEAVFSVDDDVLVPCPSLDFAFTVWQSASDTMVGFVPRMHWLGEEKGGVVSYKYGGWWSVWWMGTYSMVLSKAAFFHRKYLDMYTYKMPSTIRDYVTRERNCEDIAISLLVANVTGAPPIWVRGKIHEVGSYGISSLKGHNLRRNKCLNHFISLYGSLPLVSTNMKAVDARKEWFW